MNFVRPLSVAAVVAFAAAAPAFPAAAVPADAPLPIAGRWDVTVTGPDGEAYPSWFEIREEPSGLAMRMVGRAGAPFDVPFVAWDGSHLEFQLADGSRWRGDFNGRWFGGTLTSRMQSFTVDDAQRRALLGHRWPPPPTPRPVRWTAVRAPALAGHDVRWGRPEKLFDGRTLAGWRPRHEGSSSGWTVRDGALANRFPGDDLVSLESYKDFKLHLQFRLQPGEDSGVHLRGRYEVQLVDRDDPAAYAGSTGSIYGMIAPSIEERAEPGAWNTLDVTLIGRVVSVALNGIRIIDRQPIPGITGDALDANEGRPGPIVLQGYLGRVDYRDIEVTPSL